jgi:hypothetical protein
MNCDSMRFRKNRHSNITKMKAPSPVHTHAGSMGNHTREQVCVARARTQNHTHRARTQRHTDVFGTNCWCINTQMYLHTGRVAHHARIHKQPCVCPPYDTGAAVGGADAWLKGKLAVAAVAMGV